MANKRISELPAAGAITGTELVEIVQNGINVRSTVSAIGTGGAGTVTSFSSGDLTGLFTTNVATATTTPALSFGYVNQNANTVLAGPTTAPAAAPTFRALVAADIPSLSSLYWTLASGGTLTGANTITSNTASQLTFTGTWTATANDQQHITFSGSITARATTSDLLTYTKITPTLIAGANSQDLVAVDVAPTFTLGAFTSVTSVGLRVRAGAVGFGLGSAVPGAALHLRGTGTTSATNALVIQDSGSTNLFRLLNDGFIRLGGNGSPPNIGPTANGTALSKTGEGVMITTNVVGTTIECTSSDLSGSKWRLRVHGTNAPSSSSTAIFRDIYITSTYDFTSAGAGATAIGFDWDPSVTSVTNLWGIKITPAAALSVFGASTPATTVDINGGLALRHTSPAQITANQNDYAIGAGTAFRLNTDASRNITGLTGGVNGKILIILNVGSFNIVFTNEDAASTAANRITSSTGGSLTILPNGCVIFQYDSTSSRWRDISVR